MKNKRWLKLMLQQNVISFILEPMVALGKRNFLLHASKYLKSVEKTGETLTITHQNQPRLQIIPFKKKTIKDIAGTITHLKLKGEINKPVLDDFDTWSF